MKAAAFEHVHAASARDVVKLLAAEDGLAKPCGGTQSLGPMLNLRLVQADKLVRVSHLDELKAFELRADVLRIGAAVTHARIEDGLLPDVTHGLLPAVAASIAYRAVRNRGTLGGSLAHADPAADWVSVMCLLDAGVVLLGPNGERSVPCSEFLIGPFTTLLESDEIIVAVDVPRFSPTARWSYRKMCRKPGEFAEAVGAVWTDPERGVARALMGALGGVPLVIEGAAAIAALAQPAAMQRALDDAGLEEPYERELHAVVMRRALQDLDRFARSPA
ncbi:MAG: carbon monoxide dehydrogenase [Rhizobacter sp.]|nr:carbon monoxide dehydrogenase [Rhizobacter sp.]